MGGTDGGFAHVRLLANLMQPAALFCSEVGLRDVPRRPCNDDSRLESVQDAQMGLLQI